MFLRQHRIIRQAQLCGVALMFSIKFTDAKVKNPTHRHRLGMEVIFVDLRHNTITVKELLDDPKSRAVFQRRFGKLLRHPMVGAAHSLTLAQLAEMAAVYLPKKTIDETMEELKKL